MKKILCFLLCLTLIFSSISLCFAAAADWSTSDQQNLQNVSNRLYYNGSSAAYYLYQLVSHMSTIEGYIDQIEGFLQYGGHNITYWASSINGWLSPILSAIQQTPTNIEELQKSLTNYFIDYTQQTSWTAQDKKLNAHVSVLTGADGKYSIPLFSSSGTWQFNNYWWQEGSPIGNLALIMRQSAITAFSTSYYSLLGFNSTQTAINWGNNQTSTFIPSSAIDGIYKWFSAIQAPVSRLSYVLASDEDIEAREYAAPNQQAVVDNFIDSTGDGAASPSDIGSVSDLSAGYQQNFGSDASVSGIFDIFNSSNMGWFSQETKNQLDTTTPTRSKSAESETPLLDQQIKDIYDALGVKQP